MTREEALEMLIDAPRTDTPSRLNPSLTCKQGVTIVENAVKAMKPGAILDALSEKRVYQVSLNRKRPKY